MDVGLVCDGCHTFNPMGAKACARCGEALSLEVRPPLLSTLPGPAPVGPVGDDASAAAMKTTLPEAPLPDAAMAVPAPIAPEESSRPTLRSQARGTSPHASFEWSAAPQRACAMCGEAVEPGFKFCGSCGSVMQEETRPAVRVAPSNNAPAAGDSNSELAAALSESAGPVKRTLFFGAMQAARAKLVLIKGDGLDGVSYTLAGEEHMA